MHDRLKKWLDSKSMRSSELAEIISVNRATISHILSGRNKPSIDFLYKLLDHYPDLNINWLITGVGYMNNDKKEMQEQRSIRKVVIFYDNNSFEEIRHDNL